MAVKRTRSSSNPSFKCIWLLDVAVLASIWLIAGRSDGLAIALSALIIAAVILAVQRVLAVRRFLHDRRRKASVKPPPVPAAPAPTSPAARWPRDSQPRDYWLRQD